MTAETSQLAQPPTDLPLQFGRYLLLKRLAVGGMGEIFLARYRNAAQVDCIAVVKRILPKLNDNKEFVEHFKHEGRIASLLHHPNVVATLELGRTQDHYYLAMEYVPGTTLVRLLATSLTLGKKLSIPLCAHLATQMARALHYIHTRKSVDGREFNIIHMDLAPHNILVTPEGLLKVMDFGIARSSGLSALPHRRDFRGRTAYLAPEQLQGQILDQRLDIFAMGVIMHETLLGRPLFRAREDSQTVNRILFAPVPRPRQRRPECPECLESVILKALARDRDLRYPNAAELLFDLDRCIELSGNSLSLSQIHEELAPLMEHAGVVDARLDVT